MKHLNLLKIKEELDNSEYYLDVYYPGLEINQVYLGQIDELLEDSKWGDDNWNEEFEYLGLQLAGIGADIEMSPGCHTFIFAHRQREIDIDNWVDFSWIESLEKDWDSYGSDPPSPGDIQKTKELLERIKDTFMYEIPTLHPCSDTSVVLAWNKSLILEEYGEFKEGVGYREYKQILDIDCFEREDPDCPGNYCYTIQTKDMEKYVVGMADLKGAERMVRRYISKVYE